MVYNLFAVIFLTISSLGAALPDSASLDQPLPEGIQLTWFNASDALTTLAGFPIVFECARNENERDDVIEAELSDEMSIRQFLEAVQRQRPSYRVDSFNEDSPMPIILIFPRDPELSALSREIEIEAPCSLCSLIEEASWGGDFVHADAFFSDMGLPAVISLDGRPIEESVPENTAFCEALRQFEGLSHRTLREALVEAMAEEGDAELIFHIRWMGQRQGIAFRHSNEAMLQYTAASEIPQEWQDYSTRLRQRRATAIEALRNVDSSEEYHHIAEQIRRDWAAAASAEAIEIPH